MTYDEWTPALKLSTMWGFVEIRRHCIQMMSKLDLRPVDKVFLGTKYHVLPWLKEGYDTLIRREEVMTARELKEHVDVLGWETMARVLRLCVEMRPKSPTRCTHFECKAHAHGVTVNRVQAFCKCCGNTFKHAVVIREAQDISAAIRSEFLEDFEASEAAAA